MPTNVPSPLFHPVSGKIADLLSPEALLGCYLLTVERGEPHEPLEPGHGTTFASAAEVELAYALDKLGVHAWVWLRLPVGQELHRVRENCYRRVSDNHPMVEIRVQTTVGRILFNTILPAGLPFHDLPITRKHADELFLHCWRRLGADATRTLAERMTQLGLAHVMRSGLSFAVSDLVIPTNRGTVLADAEKEVLKVDRQFERGIITDQERYGKVIDFWTHARDLITMQMMHQFKSDRRDGKPYLNPVYHLAHSGAVGGVEHLRKLTGMVGLTAKSSGTIREAPDTSNLREGLGSVAYWWTAEAARHDTAARQTRFEQGQALGRRLRRAVGGVRVSMHDCGTFGGCARGLLYRGEERERPLDEVLSGRVSRTTISGSDAAVIVAENELITYDQARQLERLGFERILVRGPTTCEAPKGVCRLCYGADAATGLLVEVGAAVGRNASRALVDQAAELVYRSFLGYRGSQYIYANTEWKIRRTGVVRFENVVEVVNECGQRIALTGAGKVHVLDRTSAVLETFQVPRGAEILVREHQQVLCGTILCKWDPYQIPILAEVAGFVRLADVVDGETLRREKDAGGSERFMILQEPANRMPRVEIVDDQQRILAVSHLREHTYLEVRDGQMVIPGALLAKIPRIGDSSHYTSPSLEELEAIFEGVSRRSPDSFASEKSATTSATYSSLRWVILLRNRAGTGFREANGCESTTAISSRKETHSLRGRSHCETSSGSADGKR